MNTKEYEAKVNEFANWLGKNGASGLIVVHFADQVTSSAFGDRTILPIAISDILDNELHQSNRIIQLGHKMWMQKGGQPMNFDPQPQHVSQKMEVKTNKAVIEAPKTKPVKPLLEGTQDALKDVKIVEAKSDEEISEDLKE